MGIGTSEGVIRDFAGPYYVSEGNMAFGEPTRYLMLQPQNADNGVTGWDSGRSNKSNHYNLSIKRSKTIIGNPISLNSSIKMNLGIREASDIYGKRMHNLCCDNCHSHVATALGRIIALSTKKSKKRNSNSS